MHARSAQGAWSALEAAGDRLGAVLPGLLVFLTLVALGIVIGLVVRAVVTRIARAVGFDRHMERLNVGPALRQSGMLRTPSDLLGRLCFWIVFVLFASLGIDALATPGSPGVTATLIAFLPSVFVAVLILIVGWVVANFLGQGLLIAAVNRGLPEARLLARAVHWAVLLFAVATALTQLGIGKEMVLVAFGITFGGLVFAVSLAFGLGGRSLARELLARRMHRDQPVPPRERLTHL